MGNLTPTYRRSGTSQSPYHHQKNQSYHRPKTLKRSVSEQKNEEFFFTSCPLLGAQSPLRKRLKLMEDHAYLSLPNDLPSSLNNTSNNPLNKLPPISEYCSGASKDHCIKMYCNQSTKKRTNFYTNRGSTYSSPADLKQWADEEALSTSRTTSIPHSSPMSKSVTFDEKYDRGCKRKRPTSRCIAEFIENIFGMSHKKLSLNTHKTPSADVITANAINHNSQTGYSTKELFDEDQNMNSFNKHFLPKFPNISANCSDRFNTVALDSHDSDQEFSAVCKRRRVPILSRSLRESKQQDLAIASSSDGDSFWTGSSNSLTDGRTTWPTPMLEAVFLPEFPHKSVVNENSFMILGTIAKGTFGKVYRVGLGYNSDSVFAMKVQQKSTIIAKEAVQQVKDEVSIQQLLGNSDFVAQLYCVWQNRSQLYMVLQYIPGYGDMHQLWKDISPISEGAVKIWIAELAMALDFIHGRGIIYRDLKMENILLDDNGHVQLIDFGLAKWLNYGERTNTICGTLQYMAPEVLRGDDYNHGADWWSLGVLMHALLTGAYPFGVSDSHTTMNIADYEPDQFLSQPAKNLLSKLLRKDPRWRLRSFTLLKHEKFFTGINFDDVKNKKLNPSEFTPRMKHCPSCNIEEEYMPSLEEDCATNMFDEEYAVFQEFDYFNEDMRCD